MKTLYLIRHAKTEVQQQAQLDFNRELTERGIKDALETSKLLQEKKIKPDHIVCSPAKRAYTTAQIIAENLNFPVLKMEQNSLIYNASLPTLLKIVQTFQEEYKSIFLVGHNPGLTLLASFLCLPPILHIPTSGIVCIEFDVAMWKEIQTLNGKQIFFISPERK